MRRWQWYKQRTRVEHNEILNRDGETMSIISIKRPSISLWSGLGWNTLICSNTPGGIIDIGEISCAINNSSSLRGGLTMEMLNTAASPRS